MLLHHDFSVFQLTLIPIQIVVNSYPKENSEHEESGSNVFLNCVAQCLVTVAS